MPGIHYVHYIHKTKQTVRVVTKCQRLCAADSIEKYTVEYFARAMLPKVKNIVLLSSFVPFSLSCVVAAARPYIARTC